MNGIARTSRARRGRLLIVGEIPELDRLLAHVQLSSGAPIRVKNLFEALGEITTSPAGAPIATVVLCDSNMPAHSDRAVESMHKIDPSLRVVMVTANVEIGGESRDWASLGVDDCVATPIAAHELSKIFDEDLLAGGLSFEELAKRIESPLPRQKIEPPQQPVSKTRVDSPAPKSQVHEIPENVPATPVHPVAAAPLPQPPPPPATAEAAAAVTPAPTTQPLGDTDLVESLLAGPDRVTDTALQLIAQQTGWHDIALTQELSATAVAITHNNQQFGFLASAHASPTQLQPWADWLAHWLALSHSYYAYRMQAMQDDLTGAGNRRYFEEFLGDSIKSAARRRRPVTLMIFDIDNFKSYNDQFGHEAGDEILRETVRLMQAVIRQGDRVCRIGGDEFAVIFADEEAPREPGSRHPESVEVIAKRFQDQICKMRFPKLGPEAPGTLTISAGLSTYPWDGGDPTALLRHADQLALESKRKGKNLITFGQGAMRACRPAE